MTSSEFSSIMNQIKNYCQAQIKDEHMEAYRRAILHRNFNYYKEALELAFINGSLDEYIKKRLIPSPNIFNQFYLTIEQREREPKPEPEIPKDSKVSLLFIYITQMAFDARDEKKRKEPNIWAEKIFNEWQKTKLNFDILIESIYNTAIECKRQDVKEYVAEIADMVKQLSLAPVTEPESEEVEEIIEDKEPLF
jgi:hypothetical protein